MDYYAEQAQKEITRRKEKAELFVKAWQGVERKQTKDGKDFVVMANNFKTADGEKVVFNDPYSAGEQELKITIHGNLCSYESDAIDITPTIYHDSEQEKHYKETGQLVERGAYLHPYAKLTPSEIETLIAERIEYWQACVKEYEQALEHFDEYANKVVELRDSARAYIESLPAHYQFREIFEGR